MQIWKCVISCINLWFANVKSEILEGSGRFQIEAGWWKVAETNVRSAHCSAQCGHPPPPTFPPAPPQVWDQPALSYTSQFSSFVSYLLYLQREDRSFLQFHTSSFLQFELSLFFSLDSIYISTAHWHSVLYCDLSEPTFSKHPSERKWVDPICAEYGKVAVAKIRKADAPCILSTILTNRLFSVVVQTKECCPTFTGSSVFDRGSEISKYGRPD